MNQTLVQPVVDVDVPERQMPAHAPEDVPEEKCLTLLPPKGWASLELGEVWQFRDLLWTLAGRDVKLRYRQTLLGAAWVVLQPLMAAAIFAFVFGRVAKLTTGSNVPYFVFAYVSLIAWNLFGTTLNKAGSVLVGSSALVSKVYFPRMVLPLSTAFGSLLDAGVSFAVLIVIMPVYHVHPGFGLITLPIWIAMLMMLSLGIGLATSAMMVRYRDVQYILPVFTQMLLYASPVAYPLVAVPENYRFWVNINPLSGLLEGFRWSVMGGSVPAWTPMIASAVVSVVVFIAGALVFKRMEREFADVI
jgi:lipopolysaccharide transport system permease protein